MSTTNSLKLAADVVRMSEKPADVHDGSQDDSQHVTAGSTSTSDESATRSNEEDEAKYPSGPKLWLALLALSFVVILGGMDFSIVGVAVPAINERFHAIADVGWYSIACRLTACAFQCAWGQLYSIFSVRRTFSASIIIFLAGSAISAPATSSIMFIVGRAITGVGAAGILSGVFTALMAIAPLRMRPILTSALSGLEAIAMIIAPIIGGLLTQHVSWRWCFYINLPVGSTALVLLTFFLPDAKPAESKNLSWKQIFGKLDLVGNVLIIASLTCLFIALSWAGTEYAWSSGQIISLLVVFAVSLCLFAYDQYKRGDLAILPPRILKQRSIIAGFMLSVFLNGALGVLEYYIPIWFQVVRQWSPGKAGYMMIPMTIGFNISLIVSGALTSWLGYYTPFVILSAIIMPIGAGLVTTWTIEPSLFQVIFYPGMVGFASGLAFEMPQIAVQAVLPESDGPLGMSVTLFAQNFGGAFFIAIGQQVFTTHLLANLEDDIPGLTAEAVQGLGLVDLPDTVEHGTHDVLVGIHDAFIQTWYIAVALACLMIFGALAMEWRSVKEQTDETQDHEEREDEKQSNGEKMEMSPGNVEEQKPW